MTDNGSVRAAWLALAAGASRQHGGNDGYDDVIDSYYSWDSTVPNHAALRVGDAIVLWDKNVLLGVSTIEMIDVGRATKTTHSCPGCGQAHLKARKTKSPPYKCFACGNTFDSPRDVLKEVTTYRSRHDVAWVDLNAVLSGAELRRLCESPKSQLSLRPLRWGAFRDAILSQTGYSVVLPAEVRSRSLAGGHTEQLTRVRVGQGAFRRRLLERFGPTCAFSGAAPPEALDAAHLYSYASEGIHHDHGGLLLRRDLHRLFDLGLILVDPSDERLRVDAALLAFPTYRHLADQRLQIPIEPAQRRWLKQHWDRHHGVAGGAERAEYPPLPHQPRRLPSADQPLGPAGDR